jgi:PKD repeat protein/N-acetyl-anhydromuramyl-L-alanine amidase AmpD
MQKIFLVIVIIFLSFNLKAEIINNPYQTQFNNAYAQFPQIPRGLLEAVSFTQTHFKNIQNTDEGCIGLPVVNGVMGLTVNGQGYFRNNLLLISNLSGYTVSAIKSNSSTNILAYAKAYKRLMDSLNISSANINQHDVILKSLSEIPWDHNAANNFALNSFVYQVFEFLKNPINQNFYNFPNHNIDMVSIFGQQNYQVLSSDEVVISPNKISISNGTNYQPQYKSPDYAPALWVATPSCNRSSRSGTPISAVTVHTIQGTYAGAISWAQNCSANVSYHYVIRSSDGQVTQMVLEADKAWHVGSENPYTIGMEHEGYVNDASWYTQAMYNGSAGIVRDICISGYGINPLRTFFGAATTGTNTLGACTKIKGHQHYPNQTHTDPGINWDWEKYYKLINDTPSITSLTAAAGSFYDTGGATGDYSNDERELYLIQPAAGVSNITLTFAVFDLELNWDYMYIYDGATTDDPLIGIYTGTTNPTTISSTGGAILIEFRSDCATTAPGWEVSWTSSGGGTGGGTDVIAPTTLVNAISNWKTADFNATFTDADEVGGSGIKYQFYQAIDYNGSEWRANANNGFYSDNFDNTIHPDWTQQTAVWTINNSFLESADEAETNSNIYTSLNQSNDDMYLYHWGGMITGTGTNKRAGLHFMCSDPTLSNRGNSYLVYFRADNDKIQIYECVNNAINLMADVPYTIDVNQWYDFKVTYNKLSGEIDVYVDNSKQATWIDTTPLSTGNAISFRGGECVYQVNNLKVYHDRSTTELITVGANSDLRYQNTNPTTPAGRIKSIVIDSAYNISSIAFEDVNIDWTPPQDLVFVYDGTSADINTFTSNNTIEANWSISTDIHSDVATYYYAIGTTPGATDIVNWTDNWFNTSMSYSGLSLVVGTTYYVSVKVKNGAGLFSNIMTSNGQTLQNPTNPPTATFDVPNTYVCSTDSLQFINNSVDAVSYAWSVPGAFPSTSTDVNPYFSFPSTGSYTATLTVTNSAGTDSQSQSINIVVSNPTTASISASTNTIDLALNSGNVTFTNNSTNADGYFWDFGNGSTSTDANPWTGYNQAGTYNVMCVAINGVCQNDTAWTTIEVINTVGLSENEKTQVNIYPNPATNVVNIQFKNEIDKGTITIYDARGRKVLTNQINQANSTIDVSEFVKGYYIIEIKNNSLIVHSNFIKK